MYYFFFEIFITFRLSLKYRMGPENSVVLFRYWFDPKMLIFNTTNGRKEPGEDVYFLDHLHLTQRADVVSTH